MAITDLKLVPISLSPLLMSIILIYFLAQEPHCFLELNCHIFGFNFSFDLLILNSLIANYYFAVGSFWTNIIVITITFEYIIYDCKPYKLLFSL